MAPSTLARRGRLVLVWAIAILAFAFGVGAWYDRPHGPTGGWLKAAGLEPRFEQVAGRRIRFVRAGSGPAIVLLHGFASSLYTWKEVLPRLAADHDVIALDLPGFGGSECPADLSFEEFAPIVVGLADRLGLDRFMLVGNSMGGAVSLVVAAGHPERISGLVVLDPSAFDLSAKRRPWPIRLAGSRPVAALLDRLPVRRLLVSTSLRQIFYNHTLVTPDRIDEYLEPLQRPGATAAIRSLLDSRSMQPDTVEKVLPAVTAPTLIVWGREDAWIPVAQADRLQAAIPRSGKVIFGHCGHMPQEERPADVASLIAQLITK